MRMIRTTMYIKYYILRRKKKIQVQIFISYSQINFPYMCLFPRIIRLGKNRIITVCFKAIALLSLRASQVFQNQISDLNISSNAQVWISQSLQQTRDVNTILV